MRYVLVPVSEAVSTPLATYTLLLYSSNYLTSPIGVEERLQFTDGMAHILLISAKFTAAVNLHAIRVQFSCVLLLSA